MKNIVLLNNKTHRIFVFKFVGTSKNEAKKLTETHRRCKLLANFKLNLINQFSGETIDNLFENGKRFEDKYYGTYGTYDIGIELVKDKTGMEEANQWFAYYYAVPNENKELLNFFIENKPDFVYEITRAKFWTRRI